MNQTVSTLFLSLIISTAIHAQKPPVQMGIVNESGEKEGYFKVNLSEGFLISEEGGKYIYFGFYLDNELLFWNPPKWMEDCKLQEIENSDNTSDLLNGTYIFTRVGKEGWKYTIKFKHGLPEYERIDFDESGRNYEEKFFRTKFDNIECSYYSVSENKGVYYKGYYFLKNGKMKDNVRKIKVKDVSKKYKE